MGGDGTIESFGPELMQVLLAAGKGEVVTLDFPTRRLAKRFQMRLHMLRQRMREENHHDWKTVMRARTSLKWEKSGGPDDPATLTVMPHDEEFKDVLKNVRIGGQEVKIEAPRLKEDPLEDL